MIADTTIVSSIYIFGLPEGSEEAPANNWLLKWNKNNKNKAGVSRRAILKSDGEHDWSSAVVAAHLTLANIGHKFTVISVQLNQNQRFKEPDCPWL